MTELLEQLASVDVFVQKGQLMEAEARLNTFLKQNPNPTPQRLLIINKLAFCLQKQERLSEAFSLYAEALALTQQCMPRETLLRWKLAIALLRTVVDAEHIESTLALGHAVKREIQAAEPSPTTRDVLATCCFFLSQLEYRDRKFDQAEALTKQALTIWEADPSRQIDVSTCLNNLGRIEEERGHGQAGIAFHRRALALRRAILGIHPETAFSLGNLGTALAAEGLWAEAISVLEEAVAMYAETGLANAPQRKGYQANLTLCREALRHEA